MYNVDEPQSSYAEIHTFTRKWVDEEFQIVCENY